MRGLFSTIFLLLVALMIVTTEAGKNKKDKGQGSKGDCTDWRFSNCVANNGDCGSGVREGTCNDQTKKMKCKVPCNWKKEFGADCKYKFGMWSDCDAATGMKSRSGTLVKALFDAECHPVIMANKPCSTKNKAKSKGKKGKGKGN
ncbi:Midkine-B [Bagarius yarrelli]|uniref:Midkine n=1 Tax=Bagarius yarrelli TaxID=175774 RepID=A0A556VBX4_BAGYA|nr:Midkine-B [Bagarius yarrelli]